MTPKKNIFLRLGALCLALVMCLGMAACHEQGSKDPAGNTTGSNDAAQDVAYNVEVKTQGGSALKGISVYVYENDALQDLIAVLTTDEAGCASFTYKQGSGYVAVLGGVPQGYTVEKSYPITGENTQIILATQLVQGDLNTADYNLGDVMQDFTFTALDGTEYKLSTLLGEKKAVVLNFWKLNHNPCKMELPYWQEAYAEHADSVALLAMDPADSDNEKIKSYFAEQGFTFPAGACDPMWNDAMNIFGYPTTVVIDRFGIISLVNGAAFESATEIKDVLKFFTAEEYTQTVVTDYKQILTSEPEEKADSEDAQSLGEVEGRVIFNDVDFGYTKEKQILKNVSMKIPAHSFVALVGESGCGKSTIASLIMGNHRVDAGRVTIGGVDVNDIVDSALYKKITRVRHDSYLFKGTVYDNLMMGITGAGNETENHEKYSTPADIEEAMYDALKQVDLYDTIMEKGGLSMPIEEKAANLSGGQKQLITIARAFLKNPSVLILDEATSALDAKTEYEVVRSIKDRGITCIVVAHRLSTIRDCDEIIVLDDGVAVERGTHDELYALNGLYTNLVTYD